MSAQFIPAARAWLSQATHLSARQRDALAALTPALVSGLPRARPCLVGIGGPPGTGKTTLARMLAAVLAQDDTTCAVLSLDDYYLPRAARQRLAAQVHPLFATRGVPGTHELELLVEHLDRLLSGAVTGLALPRFDKPGDDRLATPESWSRPPPDVVFLEGWCIGAPPPAAASLGLDLNAVEREHDGDQRWRHAVQQFTRRYHRQLGPRLDQRWYLRPPDWDTVVDWRWQQETELGERRHFDSRAAVVEFLGTFERLCRHMQASCETWADRVIALDHGHCPIT
jgi:D-glycerate 3-kinase